MPEAQVVIDRRRAVVYGGLFCLAVAMVLRLIPYGPGLAVIVLALWFLDRHALKSVDWGLLATFAAFFTFSGNLARMEPVRMLFVRLLSHGTMLISALTCQIISNVPAAILLSRFTQDARGLLVGRQRRRRRNAGGLSGQPHHLPGIHPPRSRRRQALSHPLFRHQLRFSGSSSGCHVPSGLSRRSLSAEKQNRLAVRYAPSMNNVMMPGSKV